VANYTTEDCKKYSYALCLGDLRRVYAVIRRLNLDPETELKIACLLEQAEIRLFAAAFIDTSQWFEEGGNEVVVHHGAYSDGRPVQTRVEWEGGYATVVHPPDPQTEQSRSDPNELAEEYWDGDALERAQLMDDDADEEDAP
jgi:hypothetical protein